MICQGYWCPLGARNNLTIRELLEAQGATDIVLTLNSEPSELPSDFIPSRFKARASMQLPAS